MRHKEPSLSTEFRVRSIESGHDPLYKGMIGAIAFSTRNDLSHLGREYVEKQGQITLEQARMAEAFIIKKFEKTLSDAESDTGYIGIRLSIKTRVEMADILPALQYLFDERYGPTQGSHLSTLLNSQKDEDTVIKIVFRREQGKDFYIEKIILDARGKEEKQ